MFPAARVVADHLERYPQILRLDVRTSTETVHADYNEGKKTWTIRLQHKDGSQFTLSASHLVVATGVDILGGQKPKMPQPPGLVRPFACTSNMVVDCTAVSPTFGDKRCIPRPFVMYANGLENASSFLGLAARATIFVWRSRSKGRPKSR